MNFTILDIITVIVILVFAVFGYRNGILKTIISAVGTLLASLMSSVLSKPIAEAIYNGAFKPTIISKADSAIKLARQEGKSILDSVLDTLPNFVANSLGSFGVNAPDLKSASDHGASQVERMLAPIFISFISVITAILLFVALMIIFKIICAVIYKSMDDSALNFIDALIGGVIGIVEGFIIIMLAAFIIRIATPHMGTVPAPISDETIASSTIFEGIYNSPVITGIVSAVTDSPNTEIVEAQQSVN